MGPQAKQPQGSSWPRQRQREHRSAILGSSRNVGRFFQPGLVPNLPRRPTARIDLLELVTVLEGIHRHPEAIVFVGRQAPMTDEAPERFDDELLAVSKIRKNVVAQG